MLGSQDQPRVEGLTAVLKNLVLVDFFFFLRLTVVSVKCSQHVGAVGSAHVPVSMAPSGSLRGRGLENASRFLLPQCPTQFFAESARTNEGLAHSVEAPPIALNWVKQQGD